MVEIAARSPPHYSSLPPLTPQSTADQASHYLHGPHHPPLPTQTQGTPDSLPLSLSTRGSTLRLDPLPSHLQHYQAEAATGLSTNKDLRESRRHSQYTISSFSGSASDHSQSLSSAAMQRGASAGLYSLGERPTVSTVFEEYQPLGQSQQRQLDRRPSTIESDDGWTRDSRRAFHLRPGERPPAHLLYHPPMPARRQYTPPSSSPSVTLSPQPQRSSTISSTTSVLSSLKAPANHPFASGRTPSPNPPDGGRPIGSLPGIPPSHSYPSFNESYSMPAPIVPAHQVSLASPEDDQGDPDCPVCCESLSFTFRLPGEKPHVVPECGHALHEVSRVLLRRTDAAGMLRHGVRASASRRLSEEYWSLWCLPPAYACHWQRP